jgi:hypothetical protein
MLDTDTQPTLDQDVHALLADIDAEEPGTYPTVCNFRFMWFVMLHPNNKDLTGDPLIVCAAIASLTRKPSSGCRASHRQVAQRATTLKKMFALSEKFGWSKIMSVLNIAE